MPSTGHGNYAGLADFLAGWSKQLHERLPVTGFAVIGLTNFGEHPVQSTRPTPATRPPTRRGGRSWPPTGTTRLATCSPACPPTSGSITPR